MADDTLVQNLVDWIEVIDVATRYAAAIDQQDWDSLRDTLASDVEWSYAGRVDRLIGSDAVVSMMRESLSPRDRTQHFNTNHRVIVRGDNAEHSCYFLAIHARGERHHLGSGRYDDELRRGPLGWTFQRRTVTGIWSSGDAATS